MKKLSAFMYFDLEKFLNGKELTVTGVSSWNDFNTGEHMGTRIDTAITRDNTQYPTKDSEAVTNLYQQLTIKVSKDVNVPVGSRVLPVDAVATVFGQYRDQLSVKCTDIRVATPKGVA